MSLPSKPELSDAALDALLVGERTRVVAPLTEWGTLASVLRAEGVIRPQPATADTEYAYGSAFDHSTRRAAASSDFGPPARRSRFATWGTRVMASVVLVGSGMAIGRASSVGKELVTPVKTAVAEVNDSAVTIAPIKSRAQAQKVLAHAEHQALRAVGQYQRAAAYLAVRDTTARTARIVGGPEMYQERLAALDQVLATTREKLQTTPGDPVLVQYYQSALGAREATLQQLGRTLPATVQISHY